MRSSPASQRRRVRTQRRTAIRRRRALALAVLLTLVVLAIWCAYALPGQTPAQVPQNAGLPTAGLPNSGQSPAAGQSVVVATLEDTDVLLPVARQVTTAVAFHPVDNPDAVSFTPAGDRVSGGSLTQKLADIFAGGGGLQYHLMGGAGGSSTAGLDVGAVPGSPVASPVSGKITAIKSYKILGRYSDIEIDIQLADDPSLLMEVTHIANPKVQIGDVVTSGQEGLGVVRGFPASLDQSLSRYTSDTGDHVELVAIRVTPALASL